ncbi:MAG: ABC transporter permease [Caulobacterales bacterium]
MKYLPLVWAGIWRRPGRTALTMLSVISAFVLFGILQGFTAGLGKLVANAHADLLVTQSQVSNIDPLPIAMAKDIGRTPGVKVVARVLFLGGPFRGPNQFIPAAAVDADELRALDDQLHISVDQWAALKRTRSGALVSADLASLYGLKVGDRVPIKPTYWTNRDGTHLWPVDIVGIYPENADDNLFGRGVVLNYDYVDQSRAAGAGTVNVFVVRIDEPLKAGQIVAAIDRLSANSAHATRTFSDRQLALASVSRIGQVGLAVRMITGAVFFALLFSVGAVMIQSARERTGEFAVLKTLGFGGGALLALILAETMTFCLAAAALGLAVSALLFPTVIKAIQFNVTPGPMMSFGLLVAALLALVTGAVPAWRAARLSIVDALADR